MVQEERLSAVAKRRRLNWAPAAISESLEAPAGTSTTQPSLAKPKSRQKTETERSSNSFNGLANHNLVAFHSVASIASVGEHKVKISLAKGQECLVCGKFLLWVRHGSVLLLGTTIESTTPIQHVYHPEDEDIPAIICVSENAEFQLESDTAPDVQPSQAPSPTYEWIVPGEERVQTLSFIVDGMEPHSHVAKQIFRTRRSSVFNVRALRKIIDGFSNAEPVNTHSKRIVLCGKRLPGMMRISDGVVNHLLTTQQLLDEPTSTRGVLLLDIDFYCPSFSPPGTASLVLVKTPVLLPPYCRSPHSSDRVDILAMQYLDDATTAIEAQSKFQRLLECLSDERSKNPDINIVINGWDLLEYCSDHYLERLSQIIMPTNVFCFGDDKTTSGRFGQIMANSEQVPFHVVPHNTATMPALSDLRKAALRSYFGQLKDPVGRPDIFAVNSPNSHGLVQLSYGSDYRSAQIAAFQLRREELSIENIATYLLGSRVAILLTQKNLKLEKQNYRQAGMGFTNEHRSGQLTVFGQQHHQPSIIIHRTFAEDIPLLQISKLIDDPIMEDNECLGLGTVVHVNVSDSFVHLATPVPQESFRQCLTQGRKFLIVASRN